MAILPDGRRVITGSECGTLQVWDLETGRELASLVGHRDEITTIDVSRDGRFALSAGYDFTARLWKLPPPLSAASAEEPKVQGLLPKSPLAAPRTELNIQSAGMRVIVRDSDVRVTIETRDIIIADVLTGWSLRLDPRMPASIPPKDGGQGGRSDAEAVSPASSDTIVEIHYGRPTPVLAPAAVPKMPAPIPVQQVREFDASEKQGQGMVGDLDFAPDGKLAVSAHWDGHVRVWEVSTGKLIRRFDEHRTVVRSGAYADTVAIVNGAKFSPDGHLVASAGRDGKLLLWEAKTGRVVRQFTTRDEMLLLAFTPRGDQLLSSDGRSRVYLWDVSRIDEFRRMEHPVTRTLHLAISPDGRRALLTGVHSRPPEPESSLLRVWDLEKSDVVFELDYPPNRFVETAVFCADGRTVVAEDPSDRFKLARWNVDTGKQVDGYRLTAPARRLAVSHTGTRVLIGATEPRLLDLEMGRITALSASFWCGHRFVFSPDDRYLLTASGPITLWSLPPPDPY